MMKSFIQLALILTAVIVSTMGGEEVIMYAQVGETVTLQPKREIHPKQYVYWHLNELTGTQLAWLNPYGGRGTNTDSLWSQKLSWSNYALKINGIQEEHFGTFICKITSTEPPREYLATFILIKLNVTMKPASLLLPGESLTLMCNPGTRRHMKPNIQWVSPQGQKFQTNDGTHTFRVRSQDSGQWACVITSEKNEHKAQVSVKVLGFSPAVSPQYTSIYSPLSIPCSFPSHITWEEIKKRGIRDVQWQFIPKPSSGPISEDKQRLFLLSQEDLATWKVVQEKGLRPVSDIKEGNLSLARNRGKEGDRGSYICSIEIEKKILSSTVQVEVLQIISSPGTQLISGQGVNLSCTTGTPLPSVVQFKWFPPEKSSQQISGYGPAHLTITDVGRQDSGKWRCELWRNNTLLTFAVVTLVIEPKISGWMLVIICSTAAIIMLLLIVAFILCRHRQRKRRHLRHQLCQCKKPKPKGFYRT